MDHRARPSAAPSDVRPGHGSPLLRRTPLRSKRPTKRRWKTPRCLGWSTDPTKKTYCHLPQQSIERCQKHADWYLDGLVRDLKLTDVCEFAAVHPFPCAGPLQPNHGLDRGEKSVRWDPDNVFSGCAALNAWAHHNKRRWFGMVRRHIGDARYARLEAIADNPPKLDREAIRADLLERLAARN